MLERPLAASARASARVRAAGFRSEHPTGLNPNEVLAILRRRKLSVLACAVLFPVLTAVALHRVRPLYTATGALLYEPSEYAARELQSILRVDPATDAVMASQAEVVRGLRTAERLAGEFRLEEQPEFNPALRPMSRLGRFISPLQTRLGALLGALDPRHGPPSPENAREAVIRAVQEAISVRTVKASRVLEVSFTSEDRTLAARAANRVMQLYIADQLDSKFQAIGRANQWLEARVADLQQQVQHSEDRIAAYRAAQGLVQGVQAGLETEQISRLNVELAQARNDLAQAQGRLDAARGRTGATAQAEIAPSVVQLRAQQHRLTAELQSLLTRLGSRHPDVLARRTQLAELQHAINAEVARVVAATDADVRAATLRVSTLESSLHEAQSQVDRNAQAQIPLNAMQRDADASRTLLQAILQRIQQTAQQTAIETPDARVISNALLPIVPSYPRYKLLIAASGALGILLGLLLAYLQEISDDTFRSGDDVRRELGLQCMALVPELDSRTLRGMRTEDYVLRKPLSPFTEQLRALRTGLWLGNTHPKVIAITAARPGEGKTTLALALGRLAAMSGERVMVLDCDIRAPAFAKRMGVDAHLGLSDCMLGHATLDQAIHTDAQTGMAFMPAGQGEANSVGLFMSEHMAVLLQQLRDQYDLVLLDAPPACALTDARVLARVADATVMCVRWRSTPQAVAAHTIDLLDATGAQIAGVALTRVDARVHVRSGYADAEVYHPRLGGYFRE
ncbi:MAG: AAA family ATPase [Acetobacteraceae bacterium]|nr:AAA family ATPase [Acetobacteraceae bacterium]